MKKLGFLILILVVAFIACDDDSDCNCSGEIYGKWEVKELSTIESVIYTKNDDYDPTIEFKLDGTIELQFDANKCFGEFELSGESSINIADSGCTKICCDSDFSTKFASMLSEVAIYEIEGDKMKLNVSGWGWIELKFISD